MQRERITPERIRRFNCPEGTKQAFLWDTEAPRLAVRATAGAKAFIFESKLNRLTIRITIGDVRAWGIEEERDAVTGDVIRPGARQEARRLQTLIDQGIDPRQEKADRIAAAEEKKEQAAAREVTVGEAWSAYVAARSPKWGEHHRKAHAKAVAPGGEPVTRGRKKGQGEQTLPGMVHPLLSIRLADLNARACPGKWCKSVRD